MRRILPHFYRFKGSAQVPKRPGKVDRTAQEGLSWLLQWSHDNRGTDRTTWSRECNAPRAVSVGAMKPGTGADPWTRRGVGER